jgi:signal transduction histidine kinase/ActR/RegA family two-component response regulator
MAFDDFGRVSHDLNSIMFELQGIGRLLTSRMDDEQALWDELYDHLYAIFPDVSFYLGLYQRETGMLSLPIVCEEGIRQPYEPIPLGGYSRAVVDLGREIFIPDVEADPEKLISMNIVPDSLEPGGWARSWIGVPLRGQDNEVFGLFSVSSGEPNHFDDTSYNLIYGIASQLALGMENRRMRASDRSRRQLLNALMEAGQVVARANDPDEALETIIEQLSRLVGADSAALLLSEGESAVGERYQMYYSSQPDDFPRGGVIMLNARNPLRQAFVARMPVVLNDSQRHSGWEGFAGIPGADHLHSWMGLPMVVRDQPVGIIVLGKAEPRYYSDNSASIAFALARQAAVAVDSARARMSYESSLDAQLRNARRLTLIHRIGAMIAASLDQQQVLNTTAQLLTELFEVDHCGIMMVDETGHSARVVSEYPDWGVAGTAMTLEDNANMRRLREGGLAYSVSETEIENLDAPTREVLESTGARSTLFAPLIIGDEFLGSIGLDSTIKPRHFTEEERETVMTIAGQVAMAVRNAALYEEAVVANKLKNEFLANISHELRTPLNAIIGYTDMLVEGFYGELVEAQTDRLQRIGASGRHLLNLIGDVLDFSRLETGQVDAHPQIMMASEVAETTLSRYREKADAKGLRLELRLGTGDLSAYADPLLLDRALGNLLDNAIKFTDVGGVLVHVRPERIVHGSSDSGLRPPARLNAADGLWVAITVSDTGIGIPPDQRDAIFDSFRQVDGSVVREYGGTGLGLAITRKMIALQGGYVWVDAPPPGGSAFTVLVPAAPMLGGEPVKDNRVCVLAVDDDPEALYLLRDYLDEDAYQLIATTDPNQAVELALRYVPNVIISDVLMPDMDGFALVAALRERPVTAAIPIILMSVEDQRLQAAYQNVTDFLMKPVTRESLLQQIQAALTRSRETR